MTRDDMLGGINSILAAYYLGFVLISQGPRDWTQLPRRGLFGFPDGEHLEVDMSLMARAAAARARYSAKFTSLLRVTRASRGSLRPISSNPGFSSPESCETLRRTMTAACSVFGRLTCRSRV